MRLLLSVLLCTLVPTSCGGPRPAAKLSVFSEPATRVTVMETYERMLRLWPGPFDTFFVRTRYGPTFVLEAGPDSAPPVVLLHGFLLNIPSWIPQAESLTEHFKVYAIDCIGDMGKSRLIDTRDYPRTGGDASVWLEEVFNELSLSRAHLVGTSMGGWRALQAGLHMPERIDRMACIVPVGINPVAALQWKILTTMAFVPARKRGEKYLALLGANDSLKRFYGNHIDAAVEQAGPLVPTLSRLSRKELASLTMPTLFLFGEKDPFAGNPAKARRRLEKHMPACEVAVYPTGHLLTIEERERVNRRLVAFLSGGDTNP